MVGAPKRQLGQDVIGIANEVPVSKKQKLYDVPHRRWRWGIAGLRTRLDLERRQIYVSHVDIFLFVCYVIYEQCERIVRSAVNHAVAPISEIRLSWSDNIGT
jgi:hypothetical protein